MAVAYAANVTKFNAGGSGDNVVANGQIKTVEKVWLDSYTMAAATAIASGTTIDIAVLPNGKTITGIDLYFPALSTGAALTGTTIILGTRTAAGVTSTTVLLSSGEAAAGVLTLSANANVPHALADGYNNVCMTFQRIATTTTASTIRTVVRYT